MTGERRNGPQPNFTTPTRLKTLETAPPAHSSSGLAAVGAVRCDQGGGRFRFERIWGNRFIFFYQRNRKMRILFIEPKSPAEHVFSLARIPRLGSVLLATIMRDRGHQVRVVVEEIGGAVTPLDLAWSELVAISTSWFSVVRKAISFDPVFAAIRWHARKIVLRSRKRIREYNKILLADILEEARARLGMVMEKRDRPRRVFLAETVEEPYRRFLAAFLGRLGVKVEPIDLDRWPREAGSTLRSELERRSLASRRRSQLLLVPLREEMSAMGRHGRDLVSSLSQQIDRTLPNGFRLLALELNPVNDSLYRAAVDLGLVFRANMRRIRRAYRSALPALRA